MADTNDIRVSQQDTAKLGFTMVEVRVGSDEHQQKFSVHKDLIASRSDFFAKAMQGDWKEAEDNAIGLPEDDPALFALYLQLLYTGKLPIKRDTSEPIAKEDGEYLDAERKKHYEARKEGFQREFKSLCLLYVLCEKLVDIMGKNNIIDAMIAACKEDIMTAKGGSTHLYPPRGCVEILYNGTPPGSPARQLLVDYWCDFGTASRLQDNKSYPEEFVFDLCRTMFRNRECPSTTATRDSSNYHESLQAPSGESRWKREQQIRVAIYPHRHDLDSSKKRKYQK